MTNISVWKAYFEGNRSVLNSTYGDDILKTQEMGGRKTFWERKLWKKERATSYRDLQYQQSQIQGPQQRNYEIYLLTT